jgi:outer membrane protein OmpA-like peptidoglycan-associated protein
MLIMIFKALGSPAAGFLALILLLLSGPARLTAQESPSVRFGTLQAEPYTMVERSDWARYDNGKYTGHVYHEVRASIIPETKPETGGGGPEALLYRGNFFVLEETLRNMQAGARPVDAVVPVSFTVFRNGNMVIDEDNGYPSLRGFPAFPREAVAPGARWAARGQRTADPRNTGRTVLVPFTAEYEYHGMELYQGAPVHRVKAQYALKYRGGDFSKDFALQGAHTVDILIRAADGIPFLIRDNLDETYSWPDGSTLRFRGFTLIFSQGISPVNRETVIASLGNALGIPEKTGRPNSAVSPAPKPSPRPETKPKPPDLPAKSIELVSVPEGVRLIIRDIRFAPDSDEFLPEERPRLDIIAQALKQAAPDQDFLVEGHTASIGRPAGEMELSLRRAKRMVDELARRGIAAGRFIYKGWGGTKPLGDNNSEEGRSLNRRVEITILD